MSNDKHDYEWTDFLVLIVMLIMLAVLLWPSYKHWIVETDKQAEETILLTNLTAKLGTLRGAIERFHHDKEHYPETLDDLVQEGYLKTIPLDPLTQRRDTWVLIPPADGSGGIANVRSGAPGRASNGHAYGDW